MERWQATSESGWGRGFGNSGWIGVGDRSTLAVHAELSKTHICDLETGRRGVGIRGTGQNRRGLGYQAVRLAQIYSTLSLLFIRGLSIYTAADWRVKVHGRRRRVHNAER